MKIIKSKEKAVELLLEKNILVIYQNESELGNRALGFKSILYDPRIKDGNLIINKIKGREWWRPLAGTVLFEEKDKWFNFFSLKESPYMSFAVKVNEDIKNKIPSITHVDGTCRIQTLKKIENKHFYDLIESFFLKTGVPILLNTSFNLAEYPIVEDFNMATITMEKMNLEYIYIPE